MAATVTPRPPAQASFSIDAAEIPSGACTVLRWSVANVLFVTLDGADVPDSGAREVCPGASATYTLAWTPFSGYEERRSVSARVLSPDHRDDEEEDEPPPPEPSPTPCDINCVVTPPPDDPLAPLPTLPPAEPVPPDPTEPPPAPPVPPEPSEPPAPPPEPTAPPAP